MILNSTEWFTPLTKNGLKIGKAFDDYMTDNPEFGFNFIEASQLPTTKFSRMHVPLSLSHTKLEKRRKAWLDMAVKKVISYYKNFSVNPKNDRIYLITFERAEKELLERLQRKNIVQTGHFSNEIAGTNPDDKIDTILIVGDWISGEINNTFEHISYNGVKLSSYISYTDNQGRKRGYLLSEDTPDIVFTFIFNAIIGDYKEYINLTRRKPGRRAIVITGLFSRYTGKQKEIIAKIMKDYGLEHVNLYTSKKSI